MLKIVVGSLLLFVSLFNDQAVADGSVSQSGRGLGSGPDGMRPFDAIIKQYNASGERFRIDAHCQSACTLFLAITNVCITPAADLAFHAGHTITGGREHRAISRSATDHMLAAYKPKLRNYLLAGHYMETLEFHTISGHDMITKFGYRACP